MNQHQKFPTEGKAKMLVNGAARKSAGKNGIVYEDNREKATVQMKRKPTGARNPVKVAELGKAIVQKKAKNSSDNLLSVNASGNIIQRFPWRALAGIGGAAALAAGVMVSSPFLGMGLALGGAGLLAGSLGLFDGDEAHAPALHHAMPPPAMHHAAPPPPTYADPHTTYSQHTDPSVMPFLRNGRKFMGERGANDQRRGVRPSSAHIREDAYTPSELRHGSGLHEVVPTDMGDEVADEGNDVLTGLQSGFRTSTAEQLLNRPTRPGDVRHSSSSSSSSYEIGAHTGFAPNPSGRGSTHTKGQAAAHDNLRRVVRQDLIHESDPATAVNTLARAHLATTPHGIQILESEYIARMNPNLRAMGPIGHRGDAQHIALARHLHDRREGVKRRVRGLKRRTTRGRSPSPARLPIDPLGGGGDYDRHNPSTFEAVPNFAGAGVDTFEETANMAAWVSRPMRLP